MGMSNVDEHSYWIWFCRKRMELVVVTSDPIDFTIILRDHEGRWFKNEARSDNGE